MQPGNGYEQDRKLIEFRLKNIEAQLDEIKDAVLSLRIQAGVWGGLVGLVGGVISAVVAVKTFFRP